MIIGEIIFPRKIPNLNQRLLSGVNIFELIKPKIKKIIDKINDQYLISLSFNIGNKEIIKKKTKNTIPKFLFELLFLMFMVLLMNIKKNNAINFKIKNHF